MPISKILRAHRLPRPTATLLAASLLGGCNLAPHYAPPTVSTPAAFKEAPDWHGASPAQTVTDDRWWLLFADPTLDALEAKVDVGNQNLAAAAAQFAQARALVKEARSSLFPTIGASATAEKGGVFSGTTTAAAAAGNRVVTRQFSGAIDASWQVDLWGELSNHVRQQRSLAQASEADLRNARLSIQCELALDYIQLRSDEIQKAILDETVVSYERALTITQNRYDVGRVAQTDVLQARTQLATAKANVADIVRQRAQLEHAIAVLIGVSPSEFSLPPTTWSRLVPDVPAALPSTLLTRRPDVRGAERRIAAANAAIGIQRASFFPSLSLSGSAGGQSSAVSSLLKGTNSFWTLGADSVLTLLDFGGRAARVAEARAAYQQQAALYRQTVLTALQQVEDQLVAIRQLALVSDQRAVAANSAKRSEDLIQNQYLAGQVSYSDVIVAQTTSLSAREADAQAVAQRQAAVISLIQAIGGTWSDRPQPLAAALVDTR